MEICWRTWKNHGNVEFCESRKVRILIIFHSLHSYCAKWQRRALICFRKSMATQDGSIRVKWRQHRYWSRWWRMEGMEWSSCQRHRGRTRWSGRYALSPLWNIWKITFGKITTVRTFVWWESLVQLQVITFPPGWFVSCSQRLSLNVWLSLFIWNCVYILQPFWDFMECWIRFSTIRHL